VVLLNYEKALKSWTTLNKTAYTLIVPRLTQACASEVQVVTFGAGNELWKSLTEKIQGCTEGRINKLFSKLTTYKAAKTASEVISLIDGVLDIHRPLKALDARTTPNKGF
jgi:deferrochelatase/peroxidase EfeB